MPRQSVNGPSSLAEMTTSNVVPVSEVGQSWGIQLIVSFRHERR